HALADLVRDDGEGRRAAADQLGERVGLVEDRVVGVAAQQAVRDPERQAVHDERVVPFLELGEAPDEIVRFLDGLPVARTLGLAASGSPRVSSPITVTGSRRFSTAFPGPLWASRARTTR